MRLDAPQPAFQTPADQLSKVERVKANAPALRPRMHDEFADAATPDVSEEIEHLAKSYGVYLEYNRARTGKEKDWMYMIRVSIPGGGALNRGQWRVFDDLAEKFTTNPDGRPSLRVTTRQNIQFHWVKKPHVAEIVRQIAATGFFTLNGCGDNVRNTMGCPLSRYCEVYDANAMARRVAEYFRLPAEPYVQVFEIDTSFIRTPDQHYPYGERLLNRKFKMAFSAVHRDPHSGAWLYDNCVELRTNEIGVAPIIENDRVAAFQVYIGGGQGENNNKPTFAAHGLPLGVFTESQLHRGLEAIVKTHEEWGDRANRHWARMKYLVYDKGIAWFQQQLRERGADFSPPIPNFDPGPRMLHHGWHDLPGGNLAYGAYIENGRIINGESGRLKSMVRYLMDEYPIELMTTPNQDLLFVNIPRDAKARFERDLAEYGYGQRKGRPYSTLRRLSGACVGLYTCRLSYTESEQFEPELLDQLEALGYGDMHESVGITGCERQCFRPATKTIGWVGQGPDLYALKIGGSEDARRQGFWLVADGKWYLRRVPRNEVAKVTAALFDFYTENRLSPAEDMGSFHERIGAAAVVEYLQSHPDTAHLMEKTYDPPYRPEIPGSDASTAAGI